MAFSGALTLTDLNDFITPSQACIKPVEVKQKASTGNSVGISSKIQIDSEGSYYEVNNNFDKSGGNIETKKLEKAQISLNDCLACSGCITSAESVLITLQSHEEVLSVLNSNPPLSSPDHRVPVLSIAPQVLASLAASVSSTSTSTPSLHKILQRIRAFATLSLGFEYVYDTSFARFIAHQEHIIEFEERSAKIATQGSLPMLSSACPGWVCYAEKTHSEMLPFISTTKSPQQIMGSIVKKWLGSRLGKSPDQIYHVAVMPCYDKKLEASRQDFYNEQYRTRDVDCVITTGELELLMRQKEWDLSAPINNETDEVDLPKIDSIEDYLSAFRLPDMIQTKGSSSGSWLQTIVDHVEKREKTKGRHTIIKRKQIRTSDYEEVVIESSLATGEDAEIVFRGATCFGFRNLQNVVRKVGREAGLRVSGAAADGRFAGTSGGRGRVVRKNLRNTREQEDGQANGAPKVIKGEDRPYDYVEVMACPAGCVNGGGQARRKTPSGEASAIVNGDTAGMGARWGDREWVKTVESAYWHTRDGNNQLITQDDIVERCARRVLEEICGVEGTTAYQTLKVEALRTQYHAVVSEVVGLAVKW